MCLALAVDVDGESGNEVADKGYSYDGQENIGQRQCDRICLDDKVAGHLYEPELLLKE